VSTQRGVAQDSSGVAAAARLGGARGFEPSVQAVPREGIFSARTALSPLAATALAGALALRRRKAGGGILTSKARGGARGGEAATLSLPEQDQWIQKMDLDAFGKDVHALGEKLKNEQGEADNRHLKKMITWSRLCGVAGLATMWMGPNPFTVFALSLWTHSAWTMIGHHVCHGGYNRTDKSGKYTSRGFAVGSLAQRVTDWFDWMLPEAWGVEHNQLHHYRLGEDTDPDLLERNAADWKGMERFIMPVVSMFLWKWAYYAPNTYKELRVAEMRKNNVALPKDFNPTAPLTLSNIMEGKAKGIFSMWDLMKNVLGPYFLLHFFVLPLPCLFFGQAFYWNALANLALADVAANIHGFIVVVTNHAGNDLYKFARGCKPKSPTFYLRAVTSSANFATGGNVNDFMHGWLNYQIEHHCWPDLSMLSYQKGQPALKAICAKHGVPYVQENVFVRVWKTMAIMMQFTKMRQYPLELESKKDMMVWKDEEERLAMK